MFDFLSNPSKYFYSVLVCNTDGTWNQFLANVVSTKVIMDANFVVGMTAGGSCIVLKNRYGRTTFE